PGDHVVDGRVEHLGDPERDGDAHLAALEHHVDAQAVCQRQRALDGAPFAESRAQRLQAEAHVLLLGEGQISMRHGYAASRRAQNEGAIFSSWIACTRTLRLWQRHLRSVSFTCAAGALARTLAPNLRFTDENALSTFERL